MCNGDTKLDAATPSFGLADGLLNVYAGGSDCGRCDQEGRRDCNSEG